ncbi:hypothetical protein D9V96_018725 [Zobellia laminariae]|uniref:DUF937 domain-containing protein n=1 Tax=Zobellia barbeyronii TaxID=2748009 RepID=A0ABS5WAY5_9FLAO|nr:MULTISPECIES: hypothetical protein [Zobellia]MBT2160554.1 hypothetical protein [Zobellia barbeyronii]MUH40575.1 hypothetical protein [Zobellia laminariae]WKX75820.1 hypothetical protein Q5W13_19825 [Zobellia laminariae]
MLDQLKQMAIQKLQEKMGANSLNSEATSGAAEEGASSLIDSLMEKVSSGDLSAVTSLFSNDGNATEDSGIVQNLKGKLTEILQEKGMSASEAEAEAGNVAPGLVDSLKDKFLSNEAGDSAFSLESLSGLVGGDAGDLLSKAKGLF